MPLFGQSHTGNISTAYFLAGAISTAVVIVAGGYYIKKGDDKKYVDKATQIPDQNVGAPRILEDPHWQWMISNAIKDNVLLRLKLEDMPSGRNQVSSAAGHTVIQRFQASAVCPRHK